MRAPDAQWVSTYYIYDGERPIIEFDGNGTITARNTYGMGMDEILARDAGALYYHQDRLGNVSAVTNGVGQVVEQYRYDAFGQPEIRGGPVPGNANGALTGTPGNNVTQVNNRFLFTGREWVANYGFYEYRNRAYNPRLGRFMSEDPLGFKAGDRNLFRYCGGDPVNRMDPMGTIDTWSRLMLWQGGGDGSVSEQVANLEKQQQQTSQATGNPAEAQRLGTDKAANSAGDAKIARFPNGADAQAERDDIPREAREWNKTSPGWSRDNQCGEQADNMRRAVDARVVPIYFVSSVVGGSILPGRSEYGNHQVVQYKPTPPGKGLGFRTFLLDGYKGRYYNSAGKVSEMSPIWFKIIHPFPHRNSPEPDLE